jgi:hypothetical protein
MFFLGSIKVSFRVSFRVSFSVSLEFHLGFFRVSCNGFLSGFFFTISQCSSGFL